MNGSDIEISSRVWDSYHNCYGKVRKKFQLAFGHSFLVDQTGLGTGLPLMSPDKWLVPDGCGCPKGEEQS